MCAADRSCTRHPNSTVEAKAGGLDASVNKEDEGSGAGLLRIDGTSSRCHCVDFGHLHRAADKENIPT